MKKGSLVAGVLAGLGIGLLVAPKTGEEMRKDLSKKFDEMVKKLKEVDYGEVKNDIEAKIGEISAELKDLDKEKALDIAKKNHALNSVDVYVSGIGLGRDAAIRAVSTVGIKIDSITDVTPVAHGGVRPKGERKP